MARPLDKESVASLQHRALLYANADQKRAAALLIAAAKEFVGENKWRRYMWDAMRQRLAAEKPEAD